MKKTILFAIFALILSGCVPQVLTGAKRDSQQSFVKGKVVGGFPDDLPFYREAQVIETYKDGSGFGGLFMVDEELGRVVKFYNDALPRLGWETKVRQLDSYYLFNIKNDRLQGSVIVNTAADGKMSAITMAISQR